MINNISSMNSSLNRPQFDKTDTKLTDDQKKSLNEIISRYDSENINNETMKQMMEEIKSTGITPGKEFREIMDAAGFKPPAKPEGPPPVENTEMKEKVPDFLKEFLEKIESGKITDDDVSTLIQDLKNSGQDIQGLFVNQKV